MVVLLTIQLAMCLIILYKYNNSINRSRIYILYSKYC
nr:MAG TPA: hypothetical protein [Bacteriophage sp.]